jgi:SAM-dependent methyltransferase
MLAAYENKFPGFTDFYSRLLGYYFSACPVSHPEVAERMSVALGEMGAEADTALARFQKEGLFSGSPLSNRSQVELFWRSPLMAVFDAAIGYMPSSDIDLKRYLPKPVEGKLALVKRRQDVLERARAGEIARGDLTYWQACLANCAPELFLLPFLPAVGALRGLDIGCGWGRGTLCLPELERMEITAMDIDVGQLQIMEKLAKNMGWQGLKTITTSEFAFPDSSFDFALSMAFLHLLEEEQLRTTLLEVQRCLRHYAPFHVEAPIGSSEGITVVSHFTVQSLIDIIHSVEVGGKRFQLIEFDPRIPDLFTFVVLNKDELPLGPRSGRAAYRCRSAAKRLLALHLQ